MKYMQKKLLITLVTMVIVKIVVDKTKNPNEMFIIQRQKCKEERSFQGIYFADIERIIKRQYFEQLLLRVMTRRMQNKLTHITHERRKQTK